jgi:hypothetical protein
VKDDKIKDNEMDGAHNMYGRNEICMQVLVYKLKKRAHSEDLCTDKRTILKWTLEKGGLG